MKKWYDWLIVFTLVVFVMVAMLLAVNFLGLQDPYQLDGGSSKTKPISIR